MQINIRWNVADLATIDGDFVSQHARCWDFDRIRPVIVVVAQCIGEIEDCVL